MVNCNKFFSSNKSLILAYDQGLEHGPTDFNLDNVNPEFVIDIAEKGKYNGLATEIGIAEKYYGNCSIPLIVKLNGRSNLSREIESMQNCSVKRAIKAGANGIGYCLYPGSIHEAAMFAEFGKIVEEAHNAGMPVVAWVYPRGPNVSNELSTDTIAYAARIGLELGADIVKIKYNNDFEGLKWVVKAAGKAKVVIAGGSKLTDELFLKMAYDVMLAGASGLAVGRNIWQNKEPLKMTKALKRIVFDGERPESALDLFKK